jgi:hypothetical protein
MPKDKPAGYQKMDNSMSMHKSEWQQPEAVYSQSFENATLRTMQRTDQIQAKEAKQVKAQAYKGRYV